MRAALRMPIEIRRSPDDTQRWFALAASISIDSLELQHPVSDELEERVFVSFHLPEDALPIRAKAYLLETPPDDEHSGDVERRSLRLALEPTDQERVLRYLQG